MVKATISLDGVLLDCSEDVPSLSVLMERPFERLILTLEFRLVGSSRREPPQAHSHPLTLLAHEKIDNGLRLTYERTVSNSKQV